MLYMIHAQDRPDSLEQRLAARPAHLERLKALQQEGRLVLAGPLPAIDNPDPGPADDPEFRCRLKDGARYLCFGPDHHGFDIGEERQQFRLGKVLRKDGYLELGASVEIRNPTG